jgi:Uma2 family endonuclease
VEILSPEDRPGEIGKKVDEYLTCGTVAVAVVDPDRRAIVVHRHLTPSPTLGMNDTLDLDDVVAAFRCRVDDILG